MTREEARKAAEVMLAYANGEEIETLCSEDYVPCENPSFNWIDGKGIENYRIKPKPRYRPFKNQEECWEEMLKHQPFGWLKSIRKQEKVHIGRVFEVKDYLLITLSINEGLNTNSSYFFNEYTFADGTPFGIKEE